MYLAPLNYDKYFNKVFSSEPIAKRFLEDFLEVEIGEFEMLKGKHRVTDNSSLVEFDFRCKIDNAYVIIDMQQWYKRDVSQRFYLYHALSTGLQLEKIPEKRVIYDVSIERTKKIKDYRFLSPVITLVWMVDDTMGFKDDYVAYSMTPEIVVQFVKNKKLWHKQEIIEILKERSRVLDVLDNKNKELDFLSKNRLIFLLQKNIVKNKPREKYERWFDFAEKTKNRDNKKEDFKEYMEDEIFLKIMKRINKKELKEDDFNYIEDETKIREEVERFERGIREEAWENGVEKGLKNGMNKGIEKGMEKGRKEGRAEGRAEGEKRKALEIATKLKAKGIETSIISEASGLSEEEIDRLIE